VASEQTQQILSKFSNYVIYGHCTKFESLKYAAETRTRCGDDTHNMRRRYAQYPALMTERFMRIAHSSDEEGKNSNLKSD